MRRRGLRDQRIPRADTGSRTTVLRLLTDVLSRLQPQSVAQPADQAQALQLATAVLLIEVARADGQLVESELASIRDILRHRFTLSQEDLSALIDLAQHRAEHAHDLFSFTEQLNEVLDPQQRTQVFESLWKAAYADGHADAHEAHLLRRLADLLHLTHAQAVGARLRAEGAA